MGRSARSPALRHIPERSSGTPASRESVSTTCTTTPRSSAARTLWLGRIRAANRGKKSHGVFTPRGFNVFYPVVPNEGLEPTHPCGHQLLRLACLPIPPIRRALGGLRREHRLVLASRQRRSTTRDNTPFSCGISPKMALSNLFRFDRVESGDSPFR